MKLLHATGLAMFLVGAGSMAGVSAADLDDAEKASRTQMEDVQADSGDAKEKAGEAAREAESQKKPLTEKMKDDAGKMLDSLDM